MPETPAPSPGPGESAREPAASQTSIQIQNAGSGFPESVSWIVSRFSPFLRVQARQRLRGILEGAWEEDDLVQEVWLRALPKLQDLKPRNQKWTPVLLAYLGTTLVRYASYLCRKEIAKQGARHAPQADTPSPDELSAEVTSALSNALRNETSDAIMSCLDVLSERERITFTMRVMEGLSNQDVAEHFDESKQTASVRYSRVINRLRECVPDGALNELEAA